MTRSEWLRQATARLVEARVDSPRLSAELLLEKVCALSRLDLRLRGDVSLSPAESDRLEGLLRRRSEGEPVAYLLGEREFYGRLFRVTPATLIPRPDTETLIEAVLAAFPEDRPCTFADLGTGSGCIAVTLCAERPHWQGIMADLSPRALGIARENAGRHGTGSRLAAVRADFSRPLFQPASLDILVSNPPYVSMEEYETLSPEVRDFEPVTALVPRFCDSDRNREAHEALHHASGGLTTAGAGPNIPNADGTAGLEHLEAVAAEARIALRPGGLLFLEHGWTQGTPLRLLLERHNWEKVYTLKDLEGRDRVTIACLPA